MCLQFINVKSLKLQSNKPKKLKASTIIETLVASVIIVIIFTIASLTLNNISQGLVKKDTSAIDNHLTRLMYLHKNNKIEIPYQEDIEEWEINIRSELINNISYFIVDATNNQTKKKIQKTYIDVDI